MNQAVLSADSLVVAWLVVGSNPAWDIYFHLKFLIPACSEQLSWCHANKIKIDHSPVVIVVLEVSLHTNVKWHSVTWPYTMTTPYWSDFVPNSTFYRTLSGFHRTFATGVACRQGTLTPPDTWSRPFGTCICSTCWDQSFSELVVVLPDYALRISLGTLSILLLDPRYD